MSNRDGLLPSHCQVLPIPAALACAHSYAIKISAYLTPPNFFLPFTQQAKRPQGKKEAGKLGNKSSPTSGDEK